jgi:hypothetical protein
MNKAPKKTDKMEVKIEAKGNGPKYSTLLNESNMFSRMSELHSDGSILRRNNIRFGVKLPQLQKQERTIEPSVM